MRFMVIVKADNKSEAGILPDTKLLEAMGKYNEEQEERLRQQSATNHRNPQA